MSETVPSKFRWITQAPIQIVAKSDLEPVLTTFRNNVTSWYSEADAKGAWAEDAKALGWATGFPDEAKWLARKDAMHHMIWWPFQESHAVFAYRLDGAPVAVLGLKRYDKADTVTVHGLVAHPGAQLAGSIMIEFALNWAVATHGITTLTLHSLDEESTAFYQKMGFTRDPAGKSDEDLILIAPDRKGKEWTVLDGAWRLTAYLDFPGVLGDRAG